MPKTPKYLSLTENPNLVGALPRSLMNLRLEKFDFATTRLCEPGDREFQTWLSSGVRYLWSTGCRCDAPPIWERIWPLGGTLSSQGDMTDYTFRSGTFSTAVTVTHTPLSSGPPVLLDEAPLAAGAPPAKRLAGIRHYYQVSAVNDSGQPVTPTLPYTVTVGYSMLDLGGVVESTLALYRWDGARWVKEPTSRVDMAQDQVMATPNRFSTWAVLGEMERTYLPLVRR